MAAIREAMPIDRPALLEPAHALVRLAVAFSGPTSATFADADEAQNLRSSVVMARHGVSHKFEQKCSQASFNGHELVSLALVEP